VVAGEARGCDGVHVLARAPQRGSTAGRCRSLKKLRNPKRPLTHCGAPFSDEKALSHTPLRASHWGLEARFTNCSLPSPRFSQLLHNHTLAVAHICPAFAATPAHSHAHATNPASLAACPTCGAASHLRRRTRHEGPPPAAAPRAPRRPPPRPRAPGPGTPPGSDCACRCPNSPGGREGGKEGFGCVGCAGWSFVSKEGGGSCAMGVVVFMRPMRGLTLPC
jgi:hypothetical protein